MIYGVINKHLAAVFRDLDRHKGVVIGEGQLMIDYVHMCLSTPPNLLFQT